jgi:sarcosine oxidase
VSTDSGFIVDAHPEVEHVTVVSACSGHGFKHSAALGEHLARQATSQATEGLAPFSLARFSRRWQAERRR